MGTMYSINNWWEFFVYDETSPSCLRRISDGKPAGYIFLDKWWRVSFKGKSYLVHRIIYEMMTNTRLGNYVIDHKDLDGANNVITNLRKTTYKINNQNRPKPSNNTSGYVGVRLLKDKYWQARWQENGKGVCKSFSVEEFGNTALEMAIEFRKQRIMELNLNGQDYTENHGKEYAKRRNK